MDAIRALKLEARRVRNQAIAKARSDYEKSIGDLERLRRRLRRSERRGMFRPVVVESTELAGLTTTKAARVVLQERGPLTLAELTVEIQRRGCHPGRDPLTVQKSLRRGLQRNCKGWFVLVEGKWGVVKKGKSGLPQRIGVDENA